MASTINASTSAGIVQTADTSGVLQLQTANTAAVTIDASQNVGIGTSSPSQKVDAATSNGVNCYLSATSGSVQALYGASTGGFGNVGAMGTLGNYPQIFITNSTERMRIDSSGNLLVGTTSAISAGYFANFKASNNVMAIQRSGGTEGTVIAFYNSSGTSTGNIYNYASTTSYNTSSDYRLKENIQPMQNALDVVTQLNPVTYTWKADGSDGQGFIAHELQAVVPDCVTGEKDAVDAEGNPVYQGIDTSFLSATLTKAIQELKAIVDAQAAEIAALKGAA